MAEYSRIAKGHVTSTGRQMAINLPFAPDHVKLINYTAMATPAEGDVVKAYWDVSMGQGYAAYDFYDAGPVYSTAVATSGGISTFEAGQLLQFGARQQVVAMTKADPAVVTVTNHGYASGDVVIFQGLFQSPTTGMPQICGIPFEVTVVDANTFTIPWNTNQSNYTALSGSPSGAYVKKVLYPFLYAPGVSIISDITLGSTTTVSCTDPHNMVVGQEVAFRIPSAWGPVQLNSLPNSVVPGSPIYGFVVAVVDALTVIVNINSSAFTAFNSNQPVAGVSGMSFPQMLAVGDVNTGGMPIYSGSALYPSPMVDGAPTINGPAIQGAFVNNTSRGFIIGATVAPVASQVIYYEAILSDYAVN